VHNHLKPGQDAPLRHRRTVVVGAGKRLHHAPALQVITTNNDSLERYGEEAFQVIRIIFSNLEIWFLMPLYFPAPSSLSAALVEKIAGPGLVCRHNRCERSRCRKFSRTVASSHFCRKGQKFFKLSGNRQAHPFLCLGNQDLPWIEPRVLEGLSRSRRHRRTHWTSRRLKRRVRLRHCR
jgi:hypothetical protein